MSMNKKIIASLYKIETARKPKKIISDPLKKPIITSLKYGL